jgi:hypothetical protein
VPTGNQFRAVQYADNLLYHLSICLEGVRNTTKQFNIRVIIVPNKIRIGDFPFKNLKLFCLIQLAMLLSEQYNWNTFDEVRNNRRS